MFLALGTSLGVYPAAALPEVALANGARLVIVNGEPTPFDGYADAVSHASSATSSPPSCESPPADADPTPRVVRRGHERELRGGGSGWEYPTRR